MTFDLQQLALGVEAKAATWDTMGMVWQFTAVVPNFGKPVAAAAFQSATWLGDMTVWITGEAELVTVRLADGWNVSKHYELMSAGDLEIALHELAALIAGASVPAEAVTAWVAQDT